jgi:parallel beta-helix repeat protein
MPTIPSPIKPVATTFVVSAPDSRNPARADFRVSVGSTNAQDIINQAINQLPPSGGEIKLLEGTYTISAPIKLKDNVKLNGIPRSTVITIPNSLNTDINAFQNEDLISANSNINIRELIIDMNSANQSTGTMNGIVMLNVDGLDLIDIIIRNTLNTGVEVDGGDNITLDRLTTINNNGRTIYIHDSAGCTVTGSFATESGSHGIFIENLIAPCFISGNACILNSISGITVINSDNVRLTNNICRDNDIDGIYVQDTAGHFISNNTIIDNITNGIELQNSENGIVTNNLVSTNNGIGILANASPLNTITANRLDGNGSHGIQNTGTSVGSTIDNNKITASGGHGINNNGSSSVILASNSIGGSGSGFANINNSSGSCNIQNNLCRSQGIADYGILNSGNNNIIAHNDLLSAGTVANFSDTGTGTVLFGGNRT